jgi:hypothetical protein
MPLGSQEGGRRALENLDLKLDLVQVCGRLLDSLGYRVVPAPATALEGEGNGVGVAALASLPSPEACWAFLEGVEALQLGARLDTWLGEAGPGQAGAGGRKRRRRPPASSPPRTTNTSTSTPADLVTFPRPVDRDLKALIASKRAAINASNQVEFTTGAGLSARTDARDLSRDIQMKLDVVINESGPLQRSTRVPAQTASGGVQDQDQGHGRACPPATLGPSPGPAPGPNPGVEERLANLGAHLSVHFSSPLPIPVWRRLKALEDRLIQLEREYPPWAAFHFHQPARTDPVDGPLSLPPPTTRIVCSEQGGDFQVTTIPSRKRQALVAVTALPSGKK